MSKFDQTGRERGNWRREKEKGREKREKKKNEREAHILSRFLGDRTFGSGQSKRQSWSTHQELRVDTKINDFLQVPRSRGFSPTRFNSCLRDIQMVEVFGAGIAVHLSPKDLGLNARIWDYFRTVRDCFWTIRN